MFLLGQLLTVVAIVFVPSFIVAGFINWYLDSRRK